MFEKSLRRRIAAVVVAGSAVALTVSCSAGTPSSPSPGEGPPHVELVDSTPEATSQLESATWFMAKEPVNLDLDNDAANSQSNLIMSNVCERLNQIRPDLSLGPGLASSFEWTEPTTLVFTLRENVTFHSGAKMTADDVLWSLQRHASDEGSEADEFVNVTSIEKTGDFEITFRLKQPDAVLVQALAGNAGVVLERKAVEEQGEAFGTTRGADACSGPLQLDSWRTGEQIVLTKAEGYWNAEKASKTDKITFQWASEDAIVNSLISGEATGAYLENLASAVRLQAEDSTTVYQGPDTRVWSLMATERGGLADPRLRKALSLALDRDGVNRASLAGMGRPWNEPVGSGAWSYERKVFQAANDALSYSPAKPSEADLETAKNLVAEVGETQPIIVASDSSPIRNVIANAVVSAAQSIGLEASLEQIPTAQYGDYYSSPEVRQKADLFADDYYVSKADPVGFYKNGASDSSVQWLLNDPAYDQLISDGRAAIVDADRAEIGVALAQGWEDSMPWISVVESPSTVALSAKATGVPASGAYRYYPWAADLGTKTD